MSLPKSFLLLLLVLMSLRGQAQQRPAARPVPQPTPKGQRIELLPGTRELIGGEFNGVEIRKLIGNVSFRQGDTFMYCDSAYQYTDRNAIEAFSNVRIVQNDTLTITGDRASYNGDARTARMTGNVTMRDPRMTLTTPVLDYDLNRKLAVYSGGGHLTDPENTLDSRLGYYNTDTKVFSFRRDVRVQTKDYLITGDTLQYNTVSKVVYFFGPTRIKGARGTLYAENGNYNSVTRISNFERNAKIETTDYLLGGDKLYYDESREYGVATGRVSMVSKKDEITLRGDVGRYWRGAGRAKLHGGAVMRSISGQDTLYLAADTLVSIDSRPPARPGGFIYAYPKVRIFRPDLQGRADSLTYNRADSVIYLNGRPVLWNKQNQLTADSMELRLKRQKIDQLRLYANSFIVGQDTLLNFNQVKGRNMVGYFQAGKLKKVDVLGNAESLYYALEGDTALTGLNKALSATMALRFGPDGKLQTISFLKNPDASFIPPHELKPTDKELKGFSWRLTERPTRQATLGKHFARPAKPRPKPAKKAKKTPAPVPTRKRTGPRATTPATQARPAPAAPAATRPAPAPAAPARTTPRLLPSARNPLKPGPAVRRP